ncbi:DUF159-domain-containing protein [Trematosphaeria pertusa]|uniref:DUF159-domain-containing protein n=1 Tax=Trematosphaeria pertusa TaxID=390896 RepID=A0A6A6I1U3_9PLEO|nr:DUF159-domain-containing protein [Trematosphaeria pertusa]KAF2243942.1 DUF159-domain-containing protein [Trematosphaeria pertusa]
MCGRYVLALRPSEVRQQLEQSQMPVEEAPDDDSVRQSYNFAPGYHGLVYRADGPDYGGSRVEDKQEGDNQEQGKTEKATVVPADGRVDHTKYKLQAMKWGLVPFWTKRNPDYGSMLKTINCRDDSLCEDRGMWTSMKKKKRCIVVAQGFYEWLKKKNGKEKIPHFTKRKDGQLMCFAGLWDCVRYEDSDEKLYTYTVITTDSNKQLKFLHDRMPVILENGSEAIRTWLDPNRTEWSKDLQSLLKPFEGELECFPVSKEVGKVGNNSPSFVVPINSAENKNNIANFFGNQRKAAKAKKDEEAIGKTEHELGESMTKKGIKVEHGVNEARGTTNRVEGSEDNAPLPVPATLRSSPGEVSKDLKRERSEGDDDDGDTAAGAPQQKRRMSTLAAPASSQSPKKSAAKPAAKKGTRSATSNGSAAKTSPSKGDGSRKITSFFSNK